MMFSMTSTVYMDIIEDVVNKVRDEFLEDGGPGEALLNQLRRIWEIRMMQGDIRNSIQGFSALSMPCNVITPVGDLDVPYQSTNEFKTLTADIIYPPTPLQTVAQTPLPGVKSNKTCNIPTEITFCKTEIGRPSSSIPPSHLISEQTSVGIDVNVAYVENQKEMDSGTCNEPLSQEFSVTSRKRKQTDFVLDYHSGLYMPMQDGAGDCPSEANLGSNSVDNKLEIVPKSSWATTTIVQADGPASVSYDVMHSTPNVNCYTRAVNEDGYRPAPISNGGGVFGGGGEIQDEIVEDDSEPSLNENDDDDLEGAELSTDQLVLAQFEQAFGVFEF